MSALHNQIGFLSAAPASEMALDVRVCRTWTELEQFRSDWNSLLQASSQRSIFQTPEWLNAWWHAFGAQKELVALIFTDRRGKTVGIAPFYVERKRLFGIPLSVLRLVGAGSGDSDALDFITAPGRERACAEAFISWFASESKWDFCSLETLPHDSQTAQHIARSVRETGWRLDPETSPNFFVELPPTWPEYLDGLEPAFRPLLTRYPKRLQSRYRIGMLRCERAKYLDGDLQTLFTLHQMRWTGQGEPGAFSSTERRDFYFRMAHAFLERGWLEFWLLTLEDETVAAQFCFRYGKTVYLLQEGFNPKYAAEKIGYALRAHVLQEMIRSGATRYDFLGGADAYKMKFGAREGSYITLNFAGPSWLGRSHLAVRWLKQQVRRWLKRKLPARVLNAIRREKPKTATNA